MTDGNSGNDSGNDSELGDFDSDPHPPQPGEEDPTKAANQPDPQPRTLGQQRLEASDHDRQIRSGDVVRDLWGGGWQIVFQKKADTVAEYDRMQDDTKKSLLEYEGNKAMGATERDTVWQVFYLNKNNTLAGGRSGPYSFPESRICRYAYESTDGWKRGRFQEHLRDLVLEQVVGAAIDLDADDAAPITLAAIAQAFDRDAAKLAAELNDAGHLAGDQ